MSLPALRMNPTETQPTRMTDQTVWQITGCEYGYFWGNCAALLYEYGTTPQNLPNAFRMVGSVSPDNKVLISFMPIVQLGAALGTTGFGVLRQQVHNDQWYFEMQMATGTTELTAHWAYMLQTKEGDASWNQLPGTHYSVPDFLKAAGF